MLGKLRLLESSTVHMVFIFSVQICLLYFWIFKAWRACSSSSKSYACMWYFASCWVSRTWNLVPQWNGCWRHSSAYTLPFNFSSLPKWHKGNEWFVVFPFLSRVSTHQTFGTHITIKLGHRFATSIFIEVSKENSSARTRFWCVWYHDWD